MVLDLEGYLKKKSISPTPLPNICLLQKEIIPAEAGTVSVNCLSNYSIACGSKPIASLVGFHRLGLTHQECPWFLHGIHSCVNRSNFLYQRSFLCDRDHSLRLIHNLARDQKYPVSPLLLGQGLGQHKLKGQQGCWNSHAASGIFSEHNRKRLTKLQTPSLASTAASQVAWAQRFPLGFPGHL